MTQTYPAIVEIDLVFPRNDTYAPVELMPIVFAIQNAPAAALPPMRQINYEIQRVGPRTAENFVTSDVIDFPGTTNFSTDPYYAILSANTFNNTEGAFYMQWEIIASNCSHSGPVDQSEILGDLTYFTIQNGTKQLSLETGPDTCPTQSFTYNVTGTVLYSEFTRLDVCALLAEQTPPANPCAICVDDTMASSISATMTAAAISNSSPALPSFSPVPTHKQNSAMGFHCGGVGWIGSAAGLLLGFLF
jgi:hypothetical protein